MLLHTAVDATWRDVTEPWQAGFFKANLIRSFKGVGYVTKYVSKDLMEVQAAGRRPRIRASRNPRYGDEVMQHEAEIVQALQKRRIKELDVHRTNLIQLIDEVRPSERDPLWDLAMRMQMATR